jgi:hypothetical protein
MNKKLFTKDLKIDNRLYCNVYKNGFEETTNIVVFRLKQRLWLLQDDENDVYFRSSREALSYLSYNCNGISNWCIIEN